MSHFKMKINKKVALVAIVLMALPLFARAAQHQSSPGQPNPLNVTNFTSALLLVIVVVVVLINLWRTTRKYGGVIGRALRLIGTGIVLLSIEALDRATQGLAGQGVIEGITSEPFTQIAHDLLLVLALFFVTLGFVKFYSATKN